MNRSQIFANAWNAYKAQTIRTRAQFAACLKAAYAEAKPAIFNWDKSVFNKYTCATKPQYDFLKKLGLNMPFYNHFSFGFDKKQASQMIDALKNGKQIIVNY